MQRLLKLSSSLIPLWCLFLAILWFGYELIFEAKVPFFRDLGPYFYPIRFSVAESFKAGEFPLWDRHMAMGFPLLADFQSAPFYPPHLVLIFLPFFDAVRLLFLFHYLISAAGSYTLARQWGYPTYLSLIAAFLFTFGGIIVSLTNVLNHFQTAVWLPWLILTGERAIRSYSGKDFLVFSGVGLVQFLAGSPELYAISLVLLCVDIVAAAKQRAGMSWVRPLTLIIAANVLVAAVSMVQLLPTLELFLQSRRPTSIPYQEATAWSLHPISLINFFILDKEVDASLFSGVRFFFGRDPPFFISLYMGQICVFGICSWFYCAPRRDKYVLSSLIVIGISVALGRHTPIYSYLLAMPVFGLVRFPEKFVFFVYPLIILITLQGLQAFVTEHVGTAKKTLLPLVLILTLLLFVYLYCRFWADDFLTVLRWSNLVEPGLILGVLPSWLFSLERQMLLLGAMFLLLLLYKQEKLSVFLFRILVVVLVFIDLTSAHRQFQFPVELALVTDKPKIISGPGRQNYRLFSGLPSLHPSVFTMRDRSFTEVTEAVWSSFVPNIGVFYGIDYMQEIDALSRASYDIFLKTAKNFPPEKLYLLLGALNVKYITSFSPLPEGEIHMLRYFSEYPLWLYELRQVVPRAYVVPASEHETDPIRTLERLVSKDFDPMQNVLLEKLLLLDNKAEFRAEARIVEYAKQVVHILASLDQPGMLVLADSFYPGWNAYVNGRKKPIYRANLFFRAVQLPAGTHTVEFRYEPRSFAIGAAVSIITLLAILLVSMFLHLRRRRGNIIASAC